MRKKELKILGGLQAKWTADGLVKVQKGVRNWEEKGTKCEDARKRKEERMEKRKGAGEGEGRKEGEEGRREGVPDSYSLCSGTCRLDQPVHSIGFGEWVGQEAHHLLKQVRLENKQPFLCNLCVYRRRVKKPQIIKCLRHVTWWTGLDCKSYANYSPIWFCAW